MAVAGETTLEYTPTWVVAAVCTVIVAISFAVERILHYTGKYLKKKDQKPLYEALLKIKEELMLLGFISLLLAVFQERIARICIPKRFSDDWLPCKKNKDGDEKSTSHFQTTFSSFTSHVAVPRLLAEQQDSSASTGYCAKRGKDPILSTTALHHLHIFIFVLAVVHVVFCVLTIVFGGAKIRQWKSWEDAISKKEYDPEEVLKTKFTNVRDHDFIKDRFRGVGKRVTLWGWVHSFFKQFYASVTRSDYITLRLGFIMTHCRGNPKFNFHKYMIRALEADFKRVVGISWYLWIFVVVFLLLNVYGWHAYFWIAFVPFVVSIGMYCHRSLYASATQFMINFQIHTELLLAVGTKLEHVITQLAQEVGEKHVAIEGDLVVQPSDDHFWFHRPQIVLLLIHVILFQNSFELAFFFWIWLQYGFDSCIMGQLGFIIPRLVIGVFVQFLCSYSTLPLYAIVTQMGSSFKGAIFEEHIQKGLVGWAEKAKQKKGFKRNAGGGGPKQASPAAVQLAQVVKDQEVEDVATAQEKKANLGEIHPENGST